MPICEGNPLMADKFHSQGDNYADSVSISSLLLMNKVLSISSRDVEMLSTKNVPLWGESTSHQWIPLPKGRKCVDSIYLSLNKLLSKTVKYKNHIFRCRNPQFNENTVCILWHLYSENCYPKGQNYPFWMSPPNLNFCDMFFPSFHLCSIVHFYPDTLLYICKLFKRRGHNLSVD